MEVLRSGRAAKLLQACQHLSMTASLLLPAILQPAVDSAEKHSIGKQSGRVTRLRGEHRRDLALTVTVSCRHNEHLQLEPELDNPC